MASLPHPTTAPLQGLSAGQFATLVVLGAGLWFAAALLIRWLEPTGALEGSAMLLTYALVVPGTLPFVFLIRLLAKLRREQTMLGMTIVVASATLLDGIALAFFPALYGANSAAAGAVILWGAGVALFLGVFMSRPST